MSQPEQTNHASSAAEDKSIVKKPYVKPEVRHERVFETMALACGKVNTRSNACRLNRKNS
ncbi:MAG: hypothetical protein WBM14_08085 [Terracidiphilus sp.]